MKTFKSLLYALAATVLLAGCSDDETYTVQIRLLSYLNNE